MRQTIIIFLPRDYDQATPASPPVKCSVKYAEASTPLPGHRGKTAIEAGHEQDREADSETPPSNQQNVHESPIGEGGVQQSLASTQPPLDQQLGPV